MAKDYHTYNIFDFITDEYFKSWVLEPTDELNFFWQSWIDNHPEKAVEVSRAREFLLSIKFQKQEDMLERKAAIYAKVMEKSKKAAFKASSDRSSSSSKSFTILKVAASIVILLGLSLLLLNQSGEKEPQPQETTAIAYKTKMTRRGEKLTLMLPDGSMVKLNSESSLKYPTSFDTQREVHLQGEAYFEVERDTLKPFIVETGEVRTEVLGTSFNINYSPGDSMVQVAVTSGKVAVTSQHVNEKFYLLPREVLTCETAKFTKSYFDEDLLLGWKDGILAFENAGIDEITGRLSAWYDVDFEIKGSTGMKRKFSGKFKNRTLRDVLKGISYSSNFEFSIQQDKVIIELN
jgi:transmembrane sensor